MNNDTEQMTEEDWEAMAEDMAFEAWSERNL